jgi:outer membrane protein OmpA-like peptidoglycan-associated protein
MNRTIGALAMGAALLAGCQTTQHPRVIGTNPCQDTTATLYFEPSADSLTPAGREIVKVTAQHLHGCPVQELSILGLSDPAGAPQANLELSKRRAEHVRDAFLAAGLDVHEFTIRAAGAAGAESAAGAVEPVRRRVDVTVVMKPGR